MKTVDFADWLIIELNKHGWTQADLAREAGLNRQVISTYINRRREKPDSDSLIAIARALKLPPETVFRAAGLLPPAPPETEYTNQLIYLTRNLSEEKRKILLSIAEKLSEEESYTVKPIKLKKSRETPARSVLKGS